MHSPLPRLTLCLAALASVLTPAAALDVRWRIDSQQPHKPISRFIYGLNAWDPSQRPTNLTLSRFGGNRISAYNWETNASNAGLDWHHQNDSHLGGGEDPAGAVTPQIAAALRAGAGMAVTVPMLGHVAADKQGDGDVNQTPDYLTRRFKRNLPAKGTPFKLPPDTTDDVVYQDEFVHLLNQRFPGAIAAKTAPLLFSLDNEPDLWHETHARLRGDAVGQAGRNVGYAELIDISTAYAKAIKAVNPAALLLGPVNYGWRGMQTLQDAPDAQGRDFLDFYLSAMAAAERREGRRLLDVLDVHWYPEATGPGADGKPVRIIEDNRDPGVATARKQAPRSLWDPRYVETSWISAGSGPIRLIPRLLDKIQRHYPGTKLALTEYAYGAADHISGAIAHADALGILGREGVWAAAVWRLNERNDFLYGALEMFRNFDGAGASFGDHSLATHNSHPALTSVYASMDAGKPERVVIVAINKADHEVRAAVQLRHPVALGRVEHYLLTGASSKPQRQRDLRAADLRALRLPANSVSTLVLKP